MQIAVQLPKDEQSFCAFSPPKYHLLYLWRLHKVEGGLCQMASVFDFAAGRQFHLFIFAWLMHHSLVLPVCSDYAFISSNHDRLRPRGHLVHRKSHRILSQAGGQRPNLRLLNDSLGLWICCMLGRGGPQSVFTQMLNWGEWIIGQIWNLLKPVNLTTMVIKLQLSCLLWSGIE